MIDRAPTDMLSPIAQLFESDRDGYAPRKLSLRRDGHAYIVDFVQLDYAGHEQKVVFEWSTSCRFFPLSRDGDRISKSALSDQMERYVWHSLLEAAAT